MRLGVKENPQGQISDKLSNLPHLPLLLRPILPLPSSSFSCSFCFSFFYTVFLIALGGAGCNRAEGFPITGGLRHDLLQGVGFSTNCLEQRRSIYSASSFIEPVATSLHINVHPLSSSPRASQRGLERLLLFSQTTSGRFERRGENWETWSMAGTYFGEAWGMEALESAWECSREARGRLGGLGGFSKCSQDALTSLGGAYELVPKKNIGL